eukprot:TRINITY_DN1029_c0_g1_i4.p1 TRINITY_DN1029_c0_g1~~TRINITY_DN1029_c0_g1_i4.p1  ORF type:complete len:100 (+),score=16.16 TRINITY_DN1029_c0_g1_i4:921-1220(+)
MPLQGVRALTLRASGVRALWRRRDTAEGRKDYRIRQRFSGGVRCDNPPSCLSTMFPLLSVYVLSLQCEKLVIRYPPLPRPPPPLSLSPSLAPLTLSHIT